MTDYRPRDWKDEPMDIQLVDDLADVLAKTVVGWKDLTGIDLADHPNVQRVLARYRAEKSRPTTALRIRGRQVVREELPKRENPR